MKHLILFLMLVVLSIPVFSAEVNADFINPNHFQNTKQETDLVALYVFLNIKRFAPDVGGEREKELQNAELLSFAMLMDAKNKKLVNKIIKDNKCFKTKCPYSFIYKEYGKKAKNKQFVYSNGINF